MATEIKANQADPTGTGENGGMNGTRGGGHFNRAVTPGGHAEDRSQAPFPSYHRKLANPAPLGLLGFGLTTYTLSMYNYGVRGVTVPNVVVGSAFAYGGLAQLLAGMWEFASGNTFGATAFSSYGAFWISYGIIQWPSSGIVDAYTEETMLTNALGIWLSAWFIVTFLFLVASTRSSIGLVLLFFLLDITFLLLFIAEMTGSKSTQKAGGIFGILTAFNAFYVGLSGVLTSSSSWFLLPVGDISKKD